MNGEKSQKVIGILGGMGPYATVMFMKNILDMTHAEKDWDHIHTVVDNNTQIPSRSRAILYNEASPYEAMLASCEKLLSYPVDAIVVPCNSAIYWIKEIESRMMVPVFNPVDIAVRTIKDMHGCTKIVVLAGAVSYKTELYKNTVEKEGIEYIKIPYKLQSQIEEFIEKIKLTGSNEISKLQPEFSCVVDDIVKLTTADAIILGCTEFTYFKDYDYVVPMVDSSYELALKTIEYAKGNL
jgi:aspartate racemase